MIAEREVQEKVAVEASSFFKIYKEVEKESIDGDKFMTKELIGRFSVAQLEEQKSMLMDEVAKVDEKLTEIGKVNN